MFRLKKVGFSDVKNVTRESLKFPAGEVVLRKMEKGNEKGNPTVKHLSLKDIVPNPNQPRKDFGEGMKTVGKYGVLQAIVVRPIGSGKYQIVIGERRFRAAKRAGLKTIPAIIKELSDKDALALAIIENGDRKNLNAIEEANGFKRFLAFGLTQAEIGKIIGKNQSHISHRLGLLTLPKPVQKMIISGVISASHGEELCRLKDTKLQKEYAEEAAENGLSADQLRGKISRILNPSTAKSKPRNCKFQEAIDALNEAAVQRDFEGKCRECRIRNWCSKIVEFVEGLPL